ncbi:MAG: hypothetical protein A2Y23_02155 [Clostridiales bacterium GWB2_37_7]|nr:MAG: hypothetical protein A2Y23_02155 [Clostridiales bacterium GWB2_37_7]
MCLWEEIHLDKIIKVGVYQEKFNTLLQISLPVSDICIYPGVEKHISKRHSDYLQYIDKISDIISNPDYIGKHPSIENSVELIKVFDENILVSVNLDEKNGYLYVSSLYDVKQGKIERRLNSGRLIKFE